MAADGPTGRPVTLWGVGRRTTVALAELGHRRPSPTSPRPTRAVLAARFGPRMGAAAAATWPAAAATPELVTEPWVARSRSRQTTFRDRSDERTEIEARLAAIARGSRTRWSRPGGGSPRVAVTVPHRVVLHADPRDAACRRPTADVADVEQRGAGRARPVPSRPARCGCSACAWTSLPGPAEGSPAPQTARSPRDADSRAVKRQQARATPTPRRKRRQARAMPKPRPKNGKKPARCRIPRRKTATSPRDAVVESGVGGSGRGDVRLQPSEEHSEPFDLVVVQAGAQPPVERDGRVA